MDGYVDGFPAWVKNGEHVKDIKNKSEGAIKKLQLGEDPLISVDLIPGSLKGVTFPKGDVVNIVHADIPCKEKHTALTFFIGQWFVENSGGEWCFVPALVDNPDLNLSFNVGVLVGRADQMWDATKAARSIIENSDNVDEFNLRIDFIEASVGIINSRYPLD